MKGQFSPKAHENPKTTQVRVTMPMDKPCCHQEHKCRWGQDPGNCTCVHSIFCQSWVGHCASYSGQGTTTIALWQSNKFCFKNTASKVAGATTYKTQFGWVDSLMVLYCWVWKLWNHPNSKLKKHCHKQLFARSLNYSQGSGQKKMNSTPGLPQTWPRE